MTLQIDSITRTSSVVPFDDPITIDIAYSGGAGAVQLKFGSSVVLASGGASGSFTGIVMPTDHLWNDGLLVSQPTITDMTLEDGVHVDSVWLSAWPFIPSCSPVPLGDRAYYFSGGYIDWWFIFGSADVAAPYDHWFDRTTFTHSATRQTSNPQTWFFTIPYTSISWDFGDGATATSTSPSDSPTHTYARSGQFELTAIVDYSPVWLPRETPWFDGSFDPTHLFTVNNVIIIPGDSGWHVGKIGMGA